MKCFFIGFVGAVLGLVLSMVVGSQYADYMAAAQTSHWNYSMNPPSDPPRLWMKSSRCMRRWMR